MMKAMFRMPTVVLLFFLSAITLLSSSAQYQANDSIMIYATMISPFDNPTETYDYYMLPFCKPKEIIEERETMGEFLSADRKKSTPYVLHFMKNETNVTICKVMTSDDEIANFKQAINQKYLIELWLGQHELYDFVGTPYMEQLLLKTGLIFDIAYNSNHEIVFAHINFEEGDWVDLNNLTSSTPITFKYTVRWVLYDEIMPEDRYDYEEPPGNPDDEEFSQEYMTEKI